MTATMGLGTGSAEEASQTYAARMVYLFDEDDGVNYGNTTLEPMGRTLKPPVLFMSRRQARADFNLSAVRYIESTHSNLYGVSWS